MKSSEKEFKIVVLEDNKFFNNLLSSQLKMYTDAISYDKGIYFDIQSYTNFKDCLNNITADTDIAFVDFYLGDDITGLDILKEIKERCDECKVIIISQSKTIRTSLVTLLEGASGFIFKDKDALIKSCYIVEDIVNIKTKRSPYNA